MIAAKQWIAGKEICLYPMELVDIHLQNCDQPDDNWSVLKCKVIHEFSAFKRKEGFSYDSVDMDVTEMRAGNSHIQLDTSPCTVESKCVGSAFVAELHTVLQNTSSAITDLSANVKLLLSKPGDRKNSHRFDCGLSLQQFFLSSEEEMQMLDACLQEKESRDRFVRQQN
ncbi:unnamed protein product [Schistosoma mattheei]|uniref:Uncharacterized protein n=1 Tax=Schistosoma mattheei TaxID=31246 RepID=A0A183PLT1_9TREM|nr:unnamed protein product [Schistosoma mattheei]